MAESSGLRFDHLLLHEGGAPDGPGRGPRAGDRRARHRLRPGTRLQPSGAARSRAAASPATTSRRRSSRPARAEADALGHANVALRRARRGRAGRNRSRTTSSPLSTSSTTRRSRRDVLREVARALRPDGTFLMVDVRASSDLAGNIGHPLGSVPLRDVHHALHDGVAGPERGGPGDGVGRGEGAGDAARSGLRSVEVHRLGPDDPLNNYYVARKTG